MLKGVSPSMNQVPEVVIKKGKVQKPTDPEIKSTRVDAMDEYVVSGVRRMRQGEAEQNNPNA